MPEFIDPESGEVIDADSNKGRVLSMLELGSTFDYQPLTPDQIERTMAAIDNRLGRALSVCQDLYVAVHTAEVELKRKHADAVINGPHTQISFARKYADLQTIDELKAVNIAKEALHYAEGLRDLLRNRYIGLQNINKSISTQYMGQGR